VELPKENLAQLNQLVISVQYHIRENIRRYIAQLDILDPKDIQTFTSDNLNIFISKTGNINLSTWQNYMRDQALIKFNPQENKFIKETELNPLQKKIAGIFISKLKRAFEEGKQNDSDYTKWLDESRYLKSGKGTEQKKKLIDKHFGYLKGFAFSDLFIKKEQKPLEFDIDIIENDEDIPFVFQIIENDED
jgi:hypothetical protein